MYYIKYIKYKNKYLKLKNNLLGGNYKFKPYIYESYDLYCEKCIKLIISLLKNLGDKNHFQFISYNNENRQLISMILDNNYIIGESKEYVLKIFPEEKKYILLDKIKEVLLWLNNYIWKESFIHGDLTNSNIIFDVVTDKFIIIDWFETMKYIDNKNIFIVKYLIDLYDFLNIFLIYFPYLQNELLFINNIELIKYYENDINQLYYSNKFNAELLANDIISRYKTEINIFKENVKQFIGIPIILPI